MTEAPNWPGPNGGTRSGVTHLRLVLAALGSAAIAVDAAIVHQVPRQIVPPDIDGALQILRARLR